MTNILHFGDLRLMPGLNHYYGDLYVIGSVDECADDNDLPIASTLIVDGNLYVSETAYVTELRVSGSIYANKISCLTCYSSEDICVTTELDATTIIAGMSVFVKGNIFADCIAAFESIVASFIDSTEIRTTFVECTDISSANITVDTLTINGPFILDYSPEEDVRIFASKIRSTNINIG